MQNLKIKLDKILKYFGYQLQREYQKLEIYELGIALNKFWYFKQEFTMKGESKYELSEVIDELIDEIADVCVFNMQLTEYDLRECLEIICDRYEIKEFCIEHRHLIKERVFFKVDRTLERIENGYYKQIQK